MEDRTGHTIKSRHEVVPKWRRSSEKILSKNFPWRLDPDPIKSDKTIVENKEYKENYKE
jgi:hypothetical protein